MRTWPQALPCRGMITYRVATLAVLVLEAPARPRHLPGLNGRLA
jgi:hypothetical protein